MEEEHILTRLFREGSEQVDLGNFELAIQSFRRARQVTQELGDLPLEGLTCCLLASCYGRANMPGDQERALAEANATLNKLEEAGQDDAARDLRKQMDDARKAGPPLDPEVARLLEEGWKAVRHGANASALDQFRRALDRARRFGDRGDEALALSEAGTAYTELGLWDEAVRALLPALRIHESIGNLMGQLQCHLSLAMTFEAIRHFNEALEHGQRALALARELGNSVAESRAHSTLGNTYRSIGRTQESIEHYRADLALESDQQDFSNVAVALYNLGDGYANLGRLAEAIEYLEKAIPAFRTAGNSQGEALTENSLAMALRSQGQHEDALRHLNAGLSIAHSIGDVSTAGVIGNNLGSVYRSLGLIEESYEQHMRAWQIAEAIGDPHAQGAVANNLGLTLEEMGRLGEAVQWHRRAADIATGLQMPAVECVALVNAAFLYLRLENGKEAVAAGNKALDIARLIGDRRTEANALNAIGLAHALLGQPQAGLDHLEAALDLTERWGFDAARVPILRNLAVSHRMLNHNLEALGYYSKALDLLESLRGHILSDDLRTAFFSTAADLPTEYADLLVRTEQSTKALEVAERGRARGFVDLIAESSRELRQGVDPELSKRSRETLAQLRTVREELRHLQTSRVLDSTLEIDELKLKMERLELDQRLLEGEIRRRNPRFALISSVETWSVRRIQETLLDGNVALLEYSLGETTSLLFAVTNTDYGVFRLPGRRDIERMIGDLRTAVLRRLTRYPHGDDLYRMLVAPAIPLIGGRDIIVVPDGALHYLPFSLLLTQAPDDTNEAPFHFSELAYLIRQRAVSYAPSATVAGLLAGLAPEDAKFEGVLAAYADPLIRAPAAVDQRGRLMNRSGPLPRIPETATEVWLLARVCAGIESRDRPESFDGQGVRIRTGHAATKSDVLELSSAGESFRFLHFATHGLLDASNPLFSGLAFSTTTSDDDGFWRTFEIFNARIQSEFVVLSACDTGLGRLLEGEGVVGLTRAFLYAGARALSVSLWKVADASAPHFMQALYREVLGGLPKRQAMRAAQLEMIKGPHAHPFHWAPFILVGGAN